jgi:hypothetical protein
MGWHSTSSSRRSPAFIATNINQIAYTFTPGPISGSFTETSPGVFSGCSATGSPVVQTCDVTLAPGTYAVTVTLSELGMTVGSGTQAGIVITSGTVSNFAVDINPVNSVPALGLGSVGVFYNDGHAQNISLNENELDPAGNIITTNFGPVGNYPVLTLTDSGGMANVTLPASNPIMNVPPSGVGGYTGEMLGYTGGGNAATSLTVTLSDGTSPSSIVIPYISIANNASNPSAGNVTFSGLGSLNTQQVTITESTSAASGSGLDTQLVGSSAVTPCGGHATFSPALGTAGMSLAGSTGSLTYTITAVDTVLPTCELDVASVHDPNLTTPITINFPGTLGVGVGSHARR